MDVDVEDGMAAAARADKGRLVFIGPDLNFLVSDAGAANVALVSSHRLGLGEAAP